MIVRLVHVTPKSLIKFSIGSWAGFFLTIAFFVGDFYKKHHIKINNFITGTDKN